MKLDLAKIEVGTNVRGEVAIVSSEARMAANGRYAMLTITDGDVDIQAKRWQFDGELPAPGSVLEIVADVTEYKGKRDLNIKRWKDGTTPVEEFLKGGPKSKTFLLKELESMLEMVEDEELYRFLQDFLNSVVEDADFTGAAGAVKVHHNYCGGLAQHTLEVVSLAHSMSSALHYSADCELDLDLIIAGSLLHDIGKLDTYKMLGPSVEATDACMFADHIAIGYARVMNFLKDYAVDEVKCQHLGHIILSHHGKLEYGSPVVPCSREAYIVHLADMASSKIAIMDGAIKETDKTWTEKNYFLGTRVYTGK